MNHTVQQTQDSPTSNPFLSKLKLIWADADRNRPSPPLPIPKGWTDQHDHFICVQDIKNVRHDLIAQNLKQAFPSLRKIAIDANMILERLWWLDINSDNTTFSEAMATVEKEIEDRKRARSVPKTSSSKLPKASADSDDLGGNYHANPRAASAGPRSTGTSADAFTTSAKEYKYSTIPSNENTKHNAHSEGDDMKSVSIANPKVKAVPLLVAAQQAREEMQQDVEQSRKKQGHESGGGDEKKPLKDPGLSKRNDTMGSA